MGPRARIRRSVVGCLLLVVAGCGQAKVWEDDSWAEFRSDEGRFTVLLPGKPSPQTESATTPVGPVTIHLFVVESKDGAVAVGYADYPKDLVRPGSIDRLLDSARDHAVVGLSGQLLEEQRIGLWSAAGRGLLIRSKDGVFCRSRIYLAGNRLYVIRAFGSRSNVESPVATRFLNSFEFDRDE
jgi:hypothetical protein